MAAFLQSEAGIRPAVVGSIFLLVGAAERLLKRHKRKRKPIRSARQYESKRTALWVEHVVQDILPDNIPYRMREAATALNALPVIYSGPRLRHLEIRDPPRGPSFDPPVAETEYDYNFFDDGPPIESSQ